MPVGELATHTHVETTVTTDKNPNPIVRLDKTGGNISGAVLTNLANWSNESTWYLESMETGGNKYHNNISPSTGAYAWKRIS